MGVSAYRCENSGQINDYYEFYDAVGKGAFGVVRVVSNKVTGDKRAVKLIEKSKCQTSASLAEEIRILQKLDHPNVVRFFEFFQDNAYYYLVTEYCQGGDLLTKVSQQRQFNENIAAMIMKQIFSAVEYCHANKIVHR